MPSTNPPSAMIVRLIGPVAGRGLSVRQLELVAYLAVTGGATARQFTEALWPGRDPETCVECRKKLLARTRRRLGGVHTIAHVEGTYRLVGVGVDVAAMQDALWSSSPSAWREAIPLFEGQPISGRGELWWWRKRYVAQLTAQAHELVLNAAKDATRHGDDFEAQQLLRQGLRVGRSERIYTALLAIAKRSSQDAVDTLHQEIELVYGGLVPASLQQVPQAGFNRPALYAAS